jgi:hypothetical protein
VTAAYGLTLLMFAYRADNVPDWAAFALLFALPFGASFAAGPRVALALPVAVVLAMPAGYGSGGGEWQIPVWLGMILVALVGLPLIAVGSAAPWFVTWCAGR